MSAVAVPLPVGDLRDIPLMLRRLADDIQSGAVAGVHSVIVVAKGDDLHVYGLGDAHSGYGHLLLALGMRQLEDSANQ